MPDGQGQRRAARHRQPHHGIAGRRLSLVGRQPCGQFLGKERLPLVRDGSGGSRRRLVPVGVEAGLPADRHDDRDAGLVEPLERSCVDVPAAGVVSGPQPVEQIHRMRPSALELHADVAAHRRRRYLEGFNRQSVTRIRGGGGCLDRHTREKQHAEQRRAEPADRRFHAGKLATRRIRLPCATHRLTSLLPNLSRTVAAGSA